MAKITQTNGNAKNGITGSSITVWNSGGTICDRFTVPSRNARKYCQDFPRGKYGKRFSAAIKDAK